MEKRFVRAPRRNNQNKGKGKAKVNDDSCVDIDDEQALEKIQDNAYHKNASMDDEFMGAEKLLRSPDELIIALESSILEPLALFWGRENYTKQLALTELSFNVLEQQLVSIFQEYESGSEEAKDGLEEDDDDIINQKLKKTKLNIWIKNVFCGPKIELHLIGIALDCLNYDRLFIIALLNNVSQFGVVIRMNIPDSSLPNKEKLKLEAERIGRSAKYQFLSGDYYNDPIKARSTLDFGDLYDLVAIPYSYIYAPITLIQQTFSLKNII